MPTCRRRRSIRTCCSSACVPSTIDFIRVRKLLILVVVAGIVVFALMPPARIGLPAAPAGLKQGPRGIIHIHTMRSDGTGTIDDVTRAAAADGLQFVIVTDHGDATRAPDTPDYMNGVLYIDAVEISTREGHV